MGFTMPRSFLFAAVASLAFVGAAEAAEQRVPLTPSMLTNEATFGTPEAIIDEQSNVSDPPAGEPSTAWTVPSQMWKANPQVHAYLNLGEQRELSTLWIYDTNGVGDVIISAGSPGNWKPVATYDCNAYKRWAPVKLEVATQFLRLTRVGGGSNFAEVALYQFGPGEFAALQQQKAAEVEARAARDAAIAKATEEAKNRPVVDLGPVFGQATLVDEVDVAAQDPSHLFKQDPANASRIETILGQPCRILNKTEGEAAYMTFRVGQFKLLKPGAAYMIEIEYPEDLPRSAIVLNSGNESTLGFYTGAALGDAFRPKYVNNNNESLNLPLSGKYEKWQMFFNLHDRFNDTKYVRGDGDRELAAEDGFTVTIAQYAANNLPVSHGAAVSRIRLYELADASKLNAKYQLPPDGLPRRHISWREEMADNASGSAEEKQRATKDPLDWWRYKANLMQFLGMSTYTKDLLEFGANQHWDSSPYGGDQWVFHKPANRDYWGKIIDIMSERGFEILPYYEYSGSKGRAGLGPQKRAKPLTRDDAYTHITWIESANADITDPDTYADFKKMLDATVIRFKDKAKFAGIWIRPRSQLPMGFGDPTRKRFATEANGNVEVSRKQLQDDKELYEKYRQWWFGKRRDFLAAMRQHLIDNGITDPTVLFTAVASEPGVSFPTGGDQLVTDNVEMWTKLLSQSKYEKDKETKLVSVAEVVDKHLYYNALITPRANWGNWEVHHSGPPSDPLTYKETPGVLLTHAFNRMYTVADPTTMDLFRAPAGLAMTRHYSLNENMTYDKEDKPKLGYFCADMERAGPHCMMAEAMAMANGDPRFLTYLTGRTYARGFPQYVRNFNTAFLSLPALPSTRLENATSDSQVVVRSIPTEKHGTYLAVVNAGATDRSVKVAMPVAGKVTNAATGEVLPVQGGAVQLSMYPWQLTALRIEPAN